MNVPNVDWNDIAILKEQLQGVMIETLYKQGFLTEEQRRTLLLIINHDHSTGLER